MEVASSHLGLLSPLCRSRRLRGGAPLTSERQIPLSQRRTVLYATRPKSPAQMIRATRSGAAQNLVSRGKARSVGYIDVGRLGLLQWLVRINQASLTTFALHCARIG